MNALFWKLRVGYDRVERIATRAVFHRVLPLYASDRLTLVRRLRIATKIAVPLTALVTLAGLLLWHGKTVGAAGLIFDVVGVLRIFLDEEWDRIVPGFDDEQAYPFGPPSHIMRELVADENPEALINDAGEDVPEMSRFYYLRRGLLFLLVGFVLQLAGLLMS